MELIEYYRLLRRWLWLIVIAAFAGGTLGYIVADSREPVYRAQAMLSIGSYISSPNPQTGEIKLGQDLAVTYAELARTFEVLTGTASAVDVSLTPEALRELMSTQIVPGTSLLVIQIEYTDPVMAAEIANELANQLILLSPTNLTPEQQAQVGIAVSQIDALRQEIDQLRLELNEVDEALGTADSQDTVDRLIGQRNILYEQINERTGNIASFSNTIAGYSQRTNSVEIVETARIATEPIATSPLRSGILAAVVAASLAFGVVMLIEYLNDTFRSATEVSQQLGLPVIGVIAKMAGKDNGYRGNLITENLFSQHFEQYNTLQTNLLLRTANRPRTFIITSAMPFEGKTLTAANLAIAIALGEKKVLLIDADLRKPKLHSVFGLPNIVGLTNLLRDFKLQSRANGAEPHQELWVSPGKLNEFVQETHVQNLSVITSGFTSQNPTSLLSSEILTHWIKLFFEDLKVDVVIFDTPPVLVVPDSMMITEGVDGNVVLVVEANRTKRSAATSAKERFTDVGYEVMGAVLNRAASGDLDYYGYQGYYYYSDNPGDEVKAEEAT